MLNPDRLRSALDAAGIGHTVVHSLRKPDRWVTAGAVSVEDFARVVRSEALREAYEAMFDIKGDKVTRFDAQTAIRNLAAPADPVAWLAAQPKEAAHADQT